MMHLFGPLRHLDLWSVAAFETNGSSGGGGGGGGGSSRSYASVDARQPRSSTVSQPKNTVGQTIKMDLGLSPKNESYYADLPGRQERSRAMVEESLSNKSDDGPGLSSAASRAAASGGSGVTSSGQVDPNVAAQMSAVQSAADEVTSGAGSQGDPKNLKSGTILTNASGLLTSDDDEDTRRRRSLIGS